MKKMALGIVVAIVLTGCSTTKRTGSTVANDQLQKDTMKILSPYAQAKLGCNTIASIHSSRVSVSSEGVVTERWKLSGCNNESIVQINFTPAASGGVSINVTPE